MKHILDVKSNDIWFSVDEYLPPMFQNVIVWGIVGKENCSFQCYEARRWTGFNGSLNDVDLIFQWFTPNDSVVKDVVWWTPIPTIKRAVAKEQDGGGER